MSIFNQYSFIWLATLLVILVAALLFRKKPRPSDFIALFVLLAGVGLAWSLLRPRASMLTGGAADIQDMIGRGTPVLLEFQSPY
ncbi:MAG: hypothetical protein JXB85_06410 [Anaerolineales bacterium]|nr:hypothetical protein [Anaerolineales bacterium]